MKRAIMLGISNKSVPLSVDRLTSFIMSNDLEGARKEIGEIRFHLKEIERLVGESERERDGL